MSSDPPRRTQGIRPKQPLRLDDIVTAAIRLIDDRGSSKFNIRQLASELGVFPAAIYWHVSDRRRLIGLIGAAWMRDMMPSPAGRTWIEWVREMGHAYRAAALRHPNVARLLAGELINDPTNFALPEAIISQLERGGVPREEIVHAYNAMIGATIGFVDLELGSDTANSDEECRRIEQEIHSLDPEQYPALARHLDALADRAFSLRWTSATAAPLDESFAYLVGLISDGLQRRVSTERALVVD